MNRIRELREEKKMTQVRLSIELEVSQENISAYETGKYSPSVKSLIKMRDIFNASIDYILGISDLRSDLIYIKDLRSDESDILEIYRDMDNSGKEKTKAYMQGYIDCQSSRSC